ncbi:hypothetical protein [Halomonas dongshanensis]|uniref:DUF4131 domain-containing protein n=1 Tax=Halomonas dongshanensis TaxID=2890835 RepID=A0ABT2EHC9_9GAMM|nr:hypothetical protein [Halomonas dongshanensis]MCS2611011.1 hypothetical protein [Halomonas dongshanensis]
MNPFQGSRALLFSVLIPLMLPQVIPDPLRWIWLTLVALVVLKRLGLISFGFGGSASSNETEASDSVKTGSTSHRRGVTHQGMIVAHGNAPYQFDEANRLSYYITLRSECGDDKTVWGIDLKRVARETPLAVGDTVALEFLGRKAVVVKEPVRNVQGKIVNHRQVNTHRHTWKAHVLSA